MKKNIDLEDFTYLLLATLAKKNIRHDLRNKNIKTAVLPLYYKEVIKGILCNPNRWKYMFSVLIDTDEYFRNHFSWEMKFSRELNNTVNKLNKKMVFDLELDQILIKFTDEEVKEVLARYNNIDEEVKTRLDHFTNLLNNVIFTREYMEEFYLNRNFNAIHKEEIDKYNETAGIEIKPKRKVRDFRVL